MQIWRICLLACLGVPMGVIILYIIFLTYKEVLFHSKKGVWKEMLNVKILNLWVQTQDTTQWTGRSAKVWPLEMCPVIWQVVKSVPEQFKQLHFHVTLTLRCRRARGNYFSLGWSNESSYTATIYFFPTQFWPILKWKHLIHINKTWYPVILLIATNVRDPHLGHE